MCYHCETESGIYKNRLTCCRWCICCGGALFVIALGLGAGLLTVYLPPMFKPLGPEEKYQALTSTVRDVRAMALSDQCTNYDDLKNFYENKMVWKCLDSECLPIAYRCNGYFDCNDKSDETDCMEFCEEAKKTDLRWSCNEVQVTPQNTDYGPAYPLCFHPSFYCDGWIDCNEDYPNDEEDCPAGSITFKNWENETITCSPRNNFICTDQYYCMEDKLVCDGWDNCLDGSDEWLCDDN